MGKKKFSKGGQGEKKDDQAQQPTASSSQQPPAGGAQGGQQRQPQQPSHSGRGTGSASERQPQPAAAAGAQGGQWRDQPPPQAGRGDGPQRQPQPRATGGQGQWRDQQPPQAGQGDGPQRQPQPAATGGQGRGRDQQPPQSGRGDGPQRQPQPRATGGQGQWRDQQPPQAGQGDGPQRQPQPAATGGRGRGDGSGRQPQAAASGGRGRAADQQKNKPGRDHKEWTKDSRGPPEKQFGKLSVEESQSGRGREDVGQQHQREFPPQSRYPPQQAQQGAPPPQQVPPATQQPRGPWDSQARLPSPAKQLTPAQSVTSISSQESFPAEPDRAPKGKQQGKGPKQQPKSAQAGDAGKQTKARQEGSPTDFIVPLRKQLKSGGTKGRKITIETNHLALILKHLKPAIHYDVAIEPDKPKKSMRAVMEQFRRDNYPNRYPAFDGVKNLYSSSPLPFGHEIAADVTINVDEQAKIYKVKVKFAAEVDLQCLADYFGSTARANIHMVTPQEAIQCLDIVLRNAPALNCIPVGRSFFTQPNRMIDLGEGMEMYNGVYQSAVLGWKPFLNVDVSHKAFPKMMHVLDMVQEVCGSYYQLTQPLVHQNHDAVNRFMKMLKVVYMIPNQPNSRRIMRVNELDSPAKDARFRNEQNVEMTVADYFAKVKQVPLRYPHLPCLWVGSRQRQPRILLPMEFCTIEPNQVTNRQMTPNQTSNMIRSAATSTQIRKQKIMDSVARANYNSDPCAREFSISVNTDFTKVPARILQPPSIRYHSNSVNVQKGVWRADQFCTSNQLQNWTIVCLDDRTKPPALQEFAQMMIDQGRRPLGMTIAPPKILTVRTQRYREKDTIEAKFKELKDQQLILVVIPDQKEIYNYVKQAAEISVGVMTQCVKGKNVFRPKPSTVGNILLKVNAKLNGLNHTLYETPRCLKEPCMIMGADVTHPSPESRGSVPSVAAVTASHDRYAFKYNITCRLQQSTQEIITDLANIVKEHLTYFEKTNNIKPKRIIFFRDGVSEGQFEIVVNSEVQAVRRGCAMVDPTGNYKPQLTFLVVQKRHHTRFFPMSQRDSEDRNFNVPAGTVVDTEITHPTALDFYLVSHASIQGVARPTKYRKLWDDNDMQEDELEELTYHLCHLFARCTRSVSYPAPTYYAHLAAARAKVYCENQRIDMNDLARAQRLLAIKTEIVKGTPMYFV
ncbi:protein argonaute-2-like isoform X1 [Photinus pyralis]|nr:protein argonaute-2-like isoform X1 [Photinus pyralis]